MKRVQKIWSLLLAVVMVVGMLPSFAVPAEAAAAYTYDTHLNYTESTDGTYSGIPSGVTVTYLSGNADNGSTAAPNTGYADGTPDGNFDYPGVSEIYWVKYNKIPARSGTARTPTVGVNFGGDVVLANGTRLQRTGTTSSGSYTFSDIILGAKDTVFTRGIGILPPGKGNTTDVSALASVIYDLRDSQGNAAYDYFYSVVGFTGTAKTDNTGKTMDFLVYGSKTGGITSAGDSSFELLASSGSLGKKASNTGAGLETGEINVSVAGYKTLMLVVNPEAGNSSRNAAWGNACVYQLPRTDAAVSVEWSGDNGETTNRPSEIQVELLKDGTPTGQTLTLNAAGNWSGKIESLYASSTYTYKVLTADTTHYAFSYAGGKVKAEYLFTSQAAAITWSDSNNQYSKRPSEVTVQLYSKVGDAEATPVDGKTLTLNSANNWAGSFTDLPKYTGGQQITYSVDIPSSISYYDKAVSGSAITLTCNYDPSLVTTDYTASVTWSGDTGHETERVAVVQLYADGVKVDGKTATLNNETSSYKFEGIQKYKDGTETDIVYTVQVEESKFYTYSAVTDGSFTATYIPMQTVDIPVEIVFVDNDDALGLRPAEVKVKLWADDTAVDGSEVTLNTDNSWKTSWTKNKWTDDRTADIAYKVTLAEPIAQYVAQDYADGKLTLKREAKADIVAAVAWSHGENPGTQPTEVTVSLYANDVFQEKQTLTSANLDAETQKWTYKWEAKPLWDDTADKAITYTLVVGDVADYVAAVDQTTGSITMTYQKAEGTKFNTIGKAYNVSGLPSAATAGKTYFLSDLSNGANSQIVSGTGVDYKFFENYDGKLQVFYGSTPSQQPITAADTVVGDKTYQPTDIALGAKGEIFQDGISGMATMPNQDATYITYDLTGMNMNKFYALAGMTGLANDKNSGPNATNNISYALLTFEVYGSTDGTTYKRLAYAEQVRSWLVAEFDVDITGYNYLKLAVRNTGTTNEGAAFAWADACVYSTQTSSGGSGSGGSTTPTTVDVPVAVAWVGDSADTSKRPDKVTVQLQKDGTNVDGKTLDLTADSWAGKFEGLEAGSYTVTVSTTSENYTFSVVNNTVIAEYKETSSGESGGGATTTPSQTDAYTASADGSYAGVTKAKDGNVTYLSDMTATESKNGGSGVAAYKDTVYGSTTKIVIGDQDTTFDKGLGVHPQKNDPGYATYDLSGLDVDRFYAAVGITNTTAKGSDTHKGVRFKVYGDYGDGNGYKYLADSGEILKKASGEFSVDISGVKTLKVEICANDKFDSCASAWANACVYKYDANGTVPGGDDGSGEGEGGSGGGSTDPIQPDAYTASTNGKYTSISTADDSVIYLSDRAADDSTKGKYITGYYTIHASNDTTKTARYPALDGAFPNSNTEIKFGSASIKKDFTKGLGVLPSSAHEDNQNYILLDISGISDVNRFYAVAGMTGTGKNSAGDQFAVVFEVYGSKQVVTDENDASFEKLAVSSDIFKADSGEFDVDITGYKTLKLVTVTAEGNKGGFNSGCQSVWANACVYKYDASGSDPFEYDEEEALPGVYTSSSNGSYKWISNVKNGKVTYLSQINYTKAVNSTGDKPTTKNYPYGEEGKKIIIGTKNTGFTYGLGVHPKGTSAAAYTTYDLTGLDVDRFYAAVGITNEKGKAGSSDGVYYQVYADFTGNGLYKLLAESENITGKKSGEFHVDITGAKSLKLVIFSLGEISSSGSAWANACVYKYDANGSTPNSYTVVGAANATTTKKTTTTTTKTDNTGLEHIDGFIPSEDGEYTGFGNEYLRTLTWLSDLTYKEASNTTNSANPDGQPTTLDHPYNALTDIIILGEGDRVFFKGLGVHPKDPTKPVNDSIESFTTYDVSDLNVDRFYAAVGITNEKGKEGASKGVIFKVYGDYGDGEYKLLSHSGCLTGRESGEFDLDISGVKILKLAIESASTSHASSASAWGNACVYNSANKYEGVGLPEILEPTAKPTEPVEEAPETPEATEPVGETPAQDGTSGSLVTTIVMVALGLLCLILLILLLLKNKKPGKYGGE